MENNKIDNVNHPKHYADTCSIECIEAMQIAFGTEAVKNFCKCNAFKYLWRFKNKNGEEDLNKADWYIKRVEYLNRKEYVTYDIQLENLKDIINTYKKKENSLNI